MDVNGPLNITKRIGMEVGRQFNRLYHTRGGRHPYNTNGIDVFSEDWDNLLILDACRYDSFCDYTLPGKTESRISRGAATPEWIRANFSDRELHDVVYVSSNSYYALLRNEINAEVHHFENLEERDLQDPVTGIERPEAVADVATEMASQYPNKRLLVHFGQPHYPYLGETGSDQLEPGKNLEDAVIDAQVPAQVIRDAYHETLDLAIDAVRSLLDELDGKTVVSADHGEMLGERSSPFPFRDYGHSPGVYHEHLVTVPWHVYSHGPRRDVIEEVPRGDLTTSGVEERLEKLGYR